MADEYLIREYQPGDEAGIVQTWNEVFGPMADQGFEPRTIEDQKWSALQNPAGWRMYVGVHQESGQIVSQYAAWPVRMRTQGGGTAMFGQIRDAMVHPGHRNGLKRPGLFVRTAWPFFDHYGGPDKDFVHYGMPAVRQHWRIGHAFLKYEICRPHGVLFTEPGNHPWADQAPTNVEVLDGFDEQVEWLYDRCCGPWGISAIRDADFMNWRYVAPPQREYICLGVRDAQGILRGLAVYRHMDWLIPGMGVLVDWLVPDDEPEVGKALVQALMHRAKGDAAPALGGIFPEWSPWFERFQEWGFLFRSSDLFMVSRNFHPQYSTLWLRDHWWYTMGDTDLV